MRKFYLIIKKNIRDILSKFLKVILFIYNQTNYNQISNYPNTYSIS
jgi:hypothetical protein